jgi:hypothetical protein
MKDGSPFGLAGLWENWKDPTSGEWIRTFAIITTDANEMVAVDSYIPDRIKFRDGPKIRPVAPFLEVFARTSEETLEPLTLQLFDSEKLSPATISWRVQVANLKIFRRTADCSDRIEATSRRTTIERSAPPMRLPDCPVKTRQIKHRWRPAVGHLGRGLVGFHFTFDFGERYQSRDGASLPRAECPSLCAARALLCVRSCCLSAAGQAACRSLRPLRPGPHPLADHRALKLGERDCKPISAIYADNAIRLFQTPASNSDKAICRLNAPSKSD